jgi:glycerol-3-phosphate dehydrogenase
MQRDLRRLADTTFDLVVVGAGFYGALAAWDATLRGLSVALIDKGDFGAATSFNNLKTLHGGLRSLQSLNYPQMRLFIRERRALARVAPHLVRPMPFVAPTYRHPLRAAATLRVAMMLNDVVASDRSDGIADTALHLPPSDVLTRDECLQLNPVIDPAGVTGGARWHDYQMRNADRMTLSFILSAAEAGAATGNYVEAVGVVRDGNRVAGVRARDAITGGDFTIRARTVLNAAGPWAASWLAAAVTAAHPPAAGLSRAMNVVTRRVPVSQACGGLARGRFLFLIPWRDVTLVGTSHDPHPGTPDALAISARDVETFMTEIADAFPRAGLGAADVRLVHRGLLPSQEGSGPHVKLLKESTVLDHRRDGAAGLISMFGVRYTTARHTAAVAIDAVFADRGVEPPPCTTDTTPVAGGDVGSTELLLADAIGHEGAATRDVVTRLALTYGTRYRVPLDRLQREPALAAPLGKTCSVTRGEILHAVEHEAAITLADAVIRRTEAGSAGHPGDDALAAAAAVMAAALGWDAARVAQEIANTSAFYAIAG